MILIGTHLSSLLCQAVGDLTLYISHSCKKFGVLFAGKKGKESKVKERKGKERKGKRPIDNDIDRIETIQTQRRILNYL